MQVQVHVHVLVLVLVLEHALLGLVHLHVHDVQRCILATIEDH